MLDRTMPPLLKAEWAAYARIEPFGGAHEDDRFGHGLSALATAMTGRAIFKPIMFMPPQHVIEDFKPPTTEQLTAKMHAFLGGGGADG